MAEDSGVIKQSTQEQLTGFKKRGNKNIRKRAHEDSKHSDDDAETTASSVAELLEMQKSRKRPQGISIEDLASNRNEMKDHAPSSDQDNTLQTGGMMSARTAKAMAALPSLESGGQHIDIGTEFSAETQRRDEDYDMMKFIEDEIAKRKISKIPNNDEIPVLSRPIVRPEDALLVVAENFRREGGKKSEEMLSHQMLSGIPEIDLGIEAKIKNIEATEEAKRRLMQKYRDSSDARSKSASDNPMEYVQHARYNMESYKSQAEAIPDTVPAVKKSTVNTTGQEVSTDGGKNNSEKSSIGGIKQGKPSDDAFFDRYKKNFQEKNDKERKPRRHK